VTKSDVFLKLIILSKIIKVQCKVGAINLKRSTQVIQPTRGQILIAALRAAGAFEFLENLQLALSRNHFEWRDFDQRGDSRFHPGKSNGYLAVIVRIGTIDFNLQFTKSKQISVQLIYTTSTESHTSQDSLELLAEHLQITVGPPKAHRKYSWLFPQHRFDSIASCIEYMQSIRNVIAPVA
jgi:hypothetical protein